MYSLVAVAVYLICLMYAVLDGNAEVAKALVMALPAIIAIRVSGRKDKEAQ